MIHQSPSVNNPAESTNYPPIANKLAATRPICQTCISRYRNRQSNDYQPTVGCYSCINLQLSAATSVDTNCKKQYPTSTNWWWSVGKVMTKHWSIACSGWLLVTVISWYTTNIDWYPTTIWMIHRRIYWPTVDWGVNCYIGGHPLRHKSRSN